jgi:hypothetical protein
MDKDEKETTSKVLVLDATLQMDDATLELDLQWIVRTVDDAQHCWPICRFTRLSEGVLIAYHVRQTAHDEQRDQVHARFLQLCQAAGLVEPRLFAVIEDYEWSDRNFADGIVPSQCPYPVSIAQLIVCYKFKETLQRSRRGSCGAAIVESLQTALARHHAQVPIVLQTWFDPLARRFKGQAVVRPARKSTLLDLTQDAFRIKDWLPRCGVVDETIFSRVALLPQGYATLDAWATARRAHFSLNEFNALLSQHEGERSTMAAAAMPHVNVQVVEVGLPCETNQDHACLFVLSGFSGKAEGEQALITRALGCLHGAVQTLQDATHRPLSELPVADILFVVSANEQLLTAAVAAWRAQRRAGERYPLIVDYNAAAVSLLAQKRGGEGGWFTRDMPRPEVELADLCKMALLLGNSMALPLEQIFTLGRQEIASYLMEGIFAAGRLVPLHVPLQIFFKNAQWFGPPRGGGALKRTSDVMESGESAVPAKQAGASYRGGRVLSALLGLYGQAMEIDFDSQYPSIMAEHNIFYTCQTPDTGRFARFLRHWIRQKRLFKQTQQAALGAASKLKNNVMYGCLGQHNTLIGAPTLAAQTTAKGRQYLEEAVDAAQADETIRVIMGHTDSLLLTSHDEDKVRQLCERFAHETVEGEREQPLTDITLRPVNRYRCSWIISKTHHFSILAHAPDVAQVILPRLFAPWMPTASEEEATTTRSDVHNRLALAIAEAKKHAVFPGLLNKGMPPAVQFLLLVAHFMVAAAWLEQTLVMDGERRVAWTSTLRAQYMPALLEHVPDWIHWIENPHAVSVSSAATKAAASITQPNDSNYRQWIVHKTLEVFGGQPTGAGYLPVFRNVKSGQFERMGTTFELADIDQQWWLQRVRHTMQTQLARTPGLTNGFVENMLLALQEAFGINMAFRPVARLVRMRDLAGGGGTSSSGDADSEEIAEPLRVEAQGLWNDLMSRVADDPEYSLSLPDAQEVAHSWFSTASSSAAAAEAMQVDPMAEPDEQEDATAGEDLETRLSTWWQTRFLPHLNEAVTEACQPFFIDVAMENLVRRFDWQAAVALETTSAPAFARAMAEPKAQRARDYYRRAMAALMTLFRLLLLSSAPSVAAEEEDRMHTD